MVSDLVFNERIKMAALFFNNIGIISIATGVIAPIYESIVDHGPFEINKSSIIVFGAGLMSAGVAQFLLGKLRG